MASHALANILSIYYMNNTWSPDVGMAPLTRPHKHTHARRQAGRHTPAHTAAESSRSARMSALNLENGHESEREYAIVHHWRDNSSKAYIGAEHYSYRKYYYNVHIWWRWRWPGQLSWVGVDRQYCVPICRYEAYVVYENEMAMDVARPRSIANGPITLDK